MVIHWFRQDLRLNDNKALHSLAGYDAVLPIYIFDTVNRHNDDLGGASGVWLHHGLTALDQSLGHTLSVYKGNPLDVLLELVHKYSVSAIVWNRCYEPWRIKRDTLIKNQLELLGIQVHSYNSSLLFEPFTIHKADGTPYKVFSPFYYKACLANDPATVVQTPPLPYTKDQNSLSIADLNLLPSLNWARNITRNWHISEAGAEEVWQTFLSQGIHNYKEGRNLPSKPFVSKLSPYIHFGQISVHKIWHYLRSLPETKHSAHFLSELGWREFSYNQLYYNPTLPTKNLQTKFDSFGWQYEQKILHSWQRGTTGIPFVDAGMRELWHTGYMHNRVRMVVASFLVKNLLQDWRLGAQWFMDTLFDADLASNSASWQWVAGCGYDSAPYFRIFNPIIQGQKFDPQGEYITTYLPELRHLPLKYLYTPWEAPPEVLRKAKVTLGVDYPYPIVDLKQSREAALAAFQQLKK